MFGIIWRILNWLRGGSLKLLIIAGTILLVWGIFAPVGTLVWWANSGAESLGFNIDRPINLSPNTKSNSITNSSNIDCYIVFMPGVGDFSGDELTPGEAEFLNRLAEGHPNCVTVKDVFPYSAANVSLGGERPLAPLWRFVHQAKGWRILGDIATKIRNLWRFAISTDDRYGTVYNQGIANAIIDRMQAAYPIVQSPDNPFKIIFIGTSGGVQVTLGAITYLNKWLDAKIILVSIGGVFTGDGGFNVPEHIYHLRGRGDWVDNIGFIFPSRWPWTVASPFNQAVRAGRYTEQSSGPHVHDGPSSYFGQAPVGEKGKTYVDLTLKKVNRLPIWSDRTGTVTDN